MKILDKKELYDILTGCTILGTGGGGLLEEGLKWIDQALEEGKEFRMKSLDELDDSDLVITPYYCGSISPITEESERKYGHLKVIDTEPVVEVVKVMEKYLAKNIDGIISTELGGSNTAAAFLAAAMLDKYIVDADPSGRAVPELQHTTYYVNNLPITPLATMNAYGESTVVIDVQNDFRAEDIVRAIAVASNDSVAVADHLTTVKELKEAVIPGAITYAHEIGKAYRESIENNINPSEQVAIKGGGKVVFTGYVTDFTWDTIDGFTVGTIILKGECKFKNDILKIWFKNENIVCWLNEKPYIGSPDLICTLDSKTGATITNPYYQINQKVDVIALPAPKQWTSKRGLEVFSAKSFGFDIEYDCFLNRINENGDIIPQ